MVLRADTSRTPDSRRAPRIPFDRPVRLQFDPPTDVIEAATADLSVGGMFIKTTSFRELGAKLDFRIALSDPAVLIEGSAEVVRVQGGDETERPSGMGIHFLKLQHEQAELVRCVVDAHRTTQAPRRD